MVFLAMLLNVNRMPSDLYCDHTTCVCCRSRILSLHGKWKYKTVSQLACWGQVSGFLLTFLSFSLGVNLPQINSLPSYDSERKFWQMSVGWGRRYWNSSHLKCRHMHKAEANRWGLIKWHWSRGGNLSDSPLPSLNFLLTLGDRSENHSAPIENSLSLHIVTYSLGKDHSRPGSNLFRLATRHFPLATFGRVYS